MKWRRELVIVEDPIESDHVDPLRGPRLFRDAPPEPVEEPTGEGCHLLSCLECGGRFYTNDDHDAICPVCDAAELAQMQADHKLSYGYPPRRKIQNGFYPD